MPTGRADALAFARDELVRLVEIPSYSDEEHALVDYLEARCAELELPTRRRPVAGSADNLVVGWTEAPALLLAAHLDTVRPTWEWTGRAEVDGWTVAGLGAVDDKGCIVACLLAFLLARERGVPLDALPVAIGLCVDEEVGGKGSTALAGELRPRSVVCLEGTSLRIAVAESGYVELRLRVHGRSVHGALREEGDNAIEKAIRLFTAIQELPLAWETHPLLGRNIPLISEFRGGSPLNVVPDLAELHVDVRIVPGSSARAAFEAICVLAAQHDAEVEVVEISEPFETPARSPIVEALAGASAQVRGARPALIGMPAWTDAHSFVELAGSHAVVFGPGRLSDAHHPDEAVDVTEIVEAATILAELLPAALQLAG